MRTPSRAARRGPVFWTAQPEWQGRPAFIICGGPSVLTQDLSPLKGQKVVVINKSVLTYPDADVLYFGDAKFWRKYRAEIEAFLGRVVTVADCVHSANVVRMRQMPPPGLAQPRDALMQRRTSVTAAINLVVHFGVTEIVTLGLDGKDTPEGRKWHHDPYPWEIKDGRYAAHQKDLATIVDPLKALGVKVRNASPGSAVPFWPIVTLSDVIKSPLEKAA